MSKKLGIWATTLICCAALFTALGQVWVDAASTPPPAEAATADRILIDGLKQFGPLERPGVVYLHTKHTVALEKQELSCQRCHLNEAERPGPDGMSLKFKRLADTDKAMVMEVYHTECISCHTEMTDKGTASGPVTCGGCHVEDLVPPKATRWRPIDLDRSLHYRHVKVMENKCETCHHAYDETAKKLVYRKGEEGACLYCHKAQTEENRISGRLAAHLDCVSCHRERTAAGKDAGPADCLSCHDVEAQAGIRVLKEIPRMQRNQPDAVLVRATPTNPAAAEKTGDFQILQVAFNHQAHEVGNNTCKVCHHAALDACVSCHRSEGIKEGGRVKLADAMHRASAEASCIGCHQQQQRTKPECAGCHYPLAAIGGNNSQSCEACHQVPIPGADQPPLSDTENAALARQWLDARVMAIPERSPDRIPDKVTIGTLSDQYEPAILPHRQIVYKLMDNIQGNQLAGAFHTDPLTLCQGCHHQSPAAERPPGCASCHDRQVAAKDADRPSLVAAYHQQCMTCHDRMGIVKPATQDCVGCHKKRQNG
ncbi:MAG: cytochrome c3 family protein [Desulfosarcinaceae bacterium]|nr:cytochrome c3 family protein [Desulfosarcinaceae bacterium]